MLLSRTCASAALAAVFLLVLTPASQAKDKGHGGDNKGHGNDSKQQKAEHKDEQKFEQKNEHKAGRNDHDKVVYLSHPRSNFALSPGDGYAGRGYYYGPPNAPYYYQRPDVKYYASREDFPRGNAFQPNIQNNLDDAAVQRALARLGYYQGPIDGRIGPQSMRAISKYQQARGMSVTNAIVPSLLRALGLQ